MNYKEQFIEFLVRSEVLQFGDFTAKSGRKTPYFLNLGNIKRGRDYGELGRYYAKAYLEHLQSEEVILYGPAYKGIPLSVATSIALSEEGLDLPVCFNRKEAKDHGEGGNLIGQQPKEGDSVVIIEDVMTAGTAIRETLAILEPLKVKIKAIILAVDRMERGTGEKSAVQEVSDNLGIPVYPIITVKDILAYLPGKEIEGKVIMDQQMKEKVEAYLQEYGV